ncbi:hypothetical protein BKA65DRAFT_168017 [Rhexocercosporidium sp. MPI-PUGE-AT-0058]|nr:hypothetical protein BKA65DRAFT_168017 [Rhexocercosporidium sp. MPI-PUGE-AT-0058]
MASEQSTFLRSRTLTNSAAEFTETRAGKAVIARVIDVPSGANDISNPLEFKAELDKFVPRCEIQDEADYYKPSLEMMMQFEGTLKSFCKTLRSRKLDSKLGIEIKDPKDYRIEDVLMIAQKMCTKHEDSSTTGCMHVIRRCFQAIGKHESTLAGLLNFLPTDVYGSIIYGGFTMILAAIMDHEQLRTDILTSLAEIPQKLDNVNRLRDAHIHSNRLKSCADSVFLSIFIVLERIVDKLSMNFGQKLRSKVKGRSSQIRCALDDLDNSIAGFQEEIGVCAQMRMGRIEENTDKLVVQVTEMKAGYESMRKIAENQQKYLEGRTQTEQEHAQSAVWNYLYRFFASSDDFNPTDGKLVLPQALEGSFQDPSRDQRKPKETASLAIQFPTDKNEALLQKWLKDMKECDDDTFNAIDECLRSVEILSSSEKDKVKWLIDSEDLYEWQSQSRSGVLVIEAETPPEDLTNSMSFTSALLAKSVATTTPFIVLSYFCGLERNELGYEEDSGLVSMIKALDVQLVEAIVKKKPSVDLSILYEEKNFRKASQKLKYAIGLLKDLLGILSEKDTIFIIIDSFSRMGGDEEVGDKVLGRMIEMIDSHPDIVIKLLITDPLPNCPAKEWADFLLHLPNDVDMGQQGINIDLLEQTSRLPIEKLLERQAITDLSLDEGSDDDEW